MLINNRKFRGIVTQIASSVASGTTATSTVSSNDVTNYKVHIRLSPESYKDLYTSKRPKSFPFRPGMTASADIQTTTHPDVIAVPINSVTTRDKNSGNAVNNTKTSQNKDDKKNDPDNNPDAKATANCEI